MFRRPPLKGARLKFLMKAPDLGDILKCSLFAAAAENNNKKKKNINNNKLFLIRCGGEVSVLIFYIKKGSLPTCRVHSPVA